MNKLINKNYSRAKLSPDFSLRERFESSEIENYFQNNEPCQNVWKENLRLKMMLKQAMEKESAPPRLFDSIRSRIRR